MTSRQTAGIGRQRAGDDRGDAGVADPDVDAAPLGHGGVGDRFVEVLVADVAAEHERRPGSSSATALRSGSVRATSATLAPAGEKAWARSSPSPRPAPVITTRRPLDVAGLRETLGISIRSGIGTFDCLAGHRVMHGARHRCTTFAEHWTDQYNTRRSCDDCARWTN